MRSTTKPLLGLLVAWALSMPITARAELYIVTGVRSSITSLSRTDAEALFLGYAPLYNDRRGSTLVDAPPGPVREELYQKLTGRTPAQINAHWSRLVFTGKGMPPQEARSVADAKEIIASGVNVIGYVTKNELSNSLRVLYVIQ